MPEKLEDLGFERARTVYNSLRTGLETEENIGKLIVLEPESGDYEIDKLGIESARHLGY